MTIPVPGEASSAGSVAADLDARFGDVYEALTAWRPSVASSTISGDLSAQVYQKASSLRSFVTGRIGKNGGAISEIYRDNYPTHMGGTFEVANEWPATKAALDAFISGMMTSWPEKTAKGNPAFHGFITTGPNKDELQSLSITLTAGQRTSLLGLVDGILATLTPV